MCLSKRILNTENSCHFFRLEKYSKKNQFWTFAPSPKSFFKRWAILTFMSSVCIILFWHYTFCTWLWFLLIKNLPTTIRNCSRHFSHFFFFALLYFEPHQIVASFMPFSFMAFLLQKIDDYHYNIFFILTGSHSSISGLNNFPCRAF